MLGKCKFFSKEIEPLEKNKLSDSMSRVVALNVHMCLTLIESHREFNQESIWQIRQPVTIAAVHTAEGDDGTTSIGKYISNSFMASAEVGGAIVTLFMAPYAAEMMTSMAVPAGAPIVPMFGTYIPSTFVSSAIELGVAEVTGLKLFFRFHDVDMFLNGQKELGAETGDKVSSGKRGIVRFFIERVLGNE